MRRAIFPGTFDPFTIGHFSIVTRALTFMDEVIIGIGINENKNTYFPIEKRVAMIQNFYRNDPYMGTFRGTKINQRISNSKFYMIIFVQSATIFFVS